ncbi:MAG: CopG family transcriptional regulator [Armatimonadetes bacterium]|nr:CopG family transcriptional regulator [Armatimonadota bacterium]
MERHAIHPRSDACVVRVTISLPKEELERVDERARTENRSRSNCIRHLLQFALTAPDEKPRP